MLIDVAIQHNLIKSESPCRVSCCKSSLNSSRKVHRNARIRRLSSSILVIVIPIIVSESALQLVKGGRGLLVIHHTSLVPSGPWETMLRDHLLSEIDRFVLLQLDLELPYRRQSLKPISGCWY